MCRKEASDCIVHACTLPPIRRQLNDGGLTPKSTLYHDLVCRCYSTISCSRGNTHVLETIQSHLPKVVACLPKFHRGQGLARQGRFCTISGIARPPSSNFLASASERHSSTTTRPTCLTGSSRRLATARWLSCHESAHPATEERSRGTYAQRDITTAEESIG